MTADNQNKDVVVSEEAELAAKRSYSQGVNLSDGATDQAGFAPLATPINMAGLRKANADKIPEVMKALRELDQNSEGVEPELLEKNARNAVGILPKALQQDILETAQRELEAEKGSSFLDAMLGIYRGSLG